MSTSALRILKSEGTWPEQEPAGFSPNEMEARGMKLSCPSATWQQRTPWSLKSDRDCQGAHVLLEVPGPAYPGMNIIAGEHDSTHHLEFHGLNSIQDATWLHHSY